MDDSKTSPEPPEELDSLQRVVWGVLEPHKHNAINVAFSGGIDSTALLSLVVSLRTHLGLRIRALHVNHDWTPDSDTWEAHCSRFCSDLSVPFESYKFSPEEHCARTQGRSSGKSGEARARELRYQWFARMIQSEGLLVTGHHLDDQGETLFFRLMRGASVRGLGAIRPFQRMYGLKVVRPLLDVPKERLADWVTERGLPTICDPSNSDEAYDRNLLRRQIFPVLQSRWPSAAQTLARSASHFQEAQALMEDVAADDLAHCTLQRRQNVLWDLGAVSRDALLQLSLPRVLNVLRFWVDSNGLQIPSERALRELVRQLESGGQQSCPKLTVGAAEFRCYRDGLFLIPGALEDRPAPREAQLWQGAAVEVRGPDIALRATPVGTSGVRASLFEAGPVELRWGRGAQTVQPLGRGPHRRSLRKLLQETSVPPWERERIPLIFIDGRFAAMPRIVVDEFCSTGPSEAGIEILLDDLREKRWK